MVERATVFGSAANAYERYRPGYPDAVADAVLAYAARPVRRAIEIGAGTGKATRVFARRGIGVLATDPDADMIAELRRHAPASVETAVAPLEGLGGTAPADLVIAAASLHWTTPDGRWDRVAALLVPGGVFASIAMEWRPADPDVEAAVVSAAADVAGAPAAPDAPADTEGGLRWPGGELVASDRFEDVREMRIPGALQLPVDEYMGLLGTLSRYLVLPSAVRDDVLRGVRDALPDVIRLDAPIVLHLARRAG